MPSGPTVLPGLSAKEFLADLERKGWKHKSSKPASAGAIELEVIEMWRWDAVGTLHSMVIAREGDGVRAVSAPIVRIPGRGPEMLDGVAGAYLGAIATIPYEGARPELAFAWVKQNIATPGASTTIGAAVFEIDEATTDPGQQYRLTIVASGAQTA